MGRRGTQEQPVEPRFARSRRGLLAGAAGALGLLAGETFLSATPAQAGTDGDLVLGANNSSNTLTVLAGTDASEPTFAVTNYDAGGALLASANSNNNSPGYGVNGNSNYGEGVYAQSGFTQGYNPGKTRNGVHAVTDSATDSGVWGEAVGGGYGVAGSTNSTGINGGAGVYGANHGTGPGVLGMSTGGVAVHGVGTSGGVGVLAESTLSGGSALQVTGAAVFSRSGIIGITGPSTSAIVYPTGGISAGALVLALLQNSLAGVWVASAVPDVSTGAVTINLNAALAMGVTARVAWFIVN